MVPFPCQVLLRYPYPFIIVRQSALCPSECLIQWLLSCTHRTSGQYRLIVQQPSENDRDLDLEKSPSRMEEEQMEVDKERLQVANRKPDESAAALPPTTGPPSAAVQNPVGPLNMADPNSSGPPSAATQNPAGSGTEQDQPAPPSVPWEDKALTFEERLTGWRKWHEATERETAARIEAGRPSCQQCGETHPPPHFDDKALLRRGLKAGKALDRQAEGRAKSAAAAANNPGESSSQKAIRQCKQCGRHHAKECKAPKCPRPGCKLYHFPTESCFTAAAKWAASGLKEPVGPKTAASAKDFSHWETVLGNLAGDPAALSIATELFQEDVAEATSSSKAVPSRPKRKREDEKGESPKKGDGPGQGGSSDKRRKQ